MTVITPPRAPVVGDEVDLESPVPEPEALIEEARQRQRRRVTRRARLLGVGAILAAVGFAVVNVLRGGGATARHPASISSGAAQRRLVTYEKLETVKITPLLPTERRTSEIWSTTSAPRSYRELVRVAGRPPIEIGAGPGHDSTLGTQQVAYLYRASTNTIYRTGFYLVSPRPDPALGLAPEAFFRTLIARHGVHLEGTLSLNGHTVYLLLSSGRIDYIDTHTYLPVRTVILNGEQKIIQRVLAWKTLPATRASLKLTRLAAAHPGARVRPAPQGMQAVYPDIAPGIPAGWGWRELLLSMTSS